MAETKPGERISITTEIKNQRPSTSRAMAETRWAMKWPVPWPLAPWARTRPSGVRMLR